MSAEILIGDGDATRLVPHPLRAAILGEVHARPFTPIAVPSRVVHFAFDTSGARAQTDRANLVRQTRSAYLKHRPPGTGRSFLELYNVQKLGSSGPDSKSIWRKSSGVVHWRLRERHADFQLRSNHIRVQSESRWYALRALALLPPVRAGCRKK